MEKLLLIFEKVYPLYLLILVGYPSGRCFRLDKQSAAKRERQIKGWRREKKIKILGLEIEIE